MSGDFSEYTREGPWIPVATHEKKIIDGEEKIISTSYRITNFDEFLREEATKTSNTKGI